MLLPPKLHGATIEEKRQEIKEYFNSVFMRYESLFTLLSSSKIYYQKPESLRHPLIFYYGHTATFFINKVNYPAIYGGVVHKINKDGLKISLYSLRVLVWVVMDSI